MKNKITTKSVFQASFNQNYFSHKNFIIMFKQLILAFSCILFSCVFSFAQDQHHTDNELVTENFSPTKGEVIYLKKTFWNVKYVKGDKAYPLGFRAKNLLKEFENCPEAKEEMLKYRKTLSAALLTSLGGVALATTGLALYENRVGEDDIEPNLTEASLYLIGGGAAIVGASIGATRSFNQLNKAIHLYNQSVAK